MYVTKHIDWISSSLPTNSDLYSVLPTASFRRTGRGHHGFATRFVDLHSGVVMEADSLAEPEIVLLTFSGEALENLRRSGNMGEDIRIRRLANEGAKVSRFDLTLNIHEGEVTPRIMYNALKSGAVKPRARTYRFIEGKRGDVEGDTLYIGSPTADVQFRCYNKAAETGIVDQGAWVRLELELRRIRANGALQSCRTNGISETCSGHLRDFLDWGNQEYKSALGDNGIQPLDVPRKPTNRQRWLLGQVASALANELWLNSAFQVTFDAAVKGELDRLTIENGS